MSTPTREQCIAEAAEVYGAILADPDRRARLRRDLAARQAATDSETSRHDTGDGTSRPHHTRARKSA